MEVRHWNASDTRSFFDVPSDPWLAFLTGLGFFSGMSLPVPCGSAARTSELLIRV